jgi:endoplasmic reticulum-Golgi intermediate compartment protein 3
MLPCFCKSSSQQALHTCQVVPTLYRYLNGTTIQTNQFSVTERGLPGVFFFYEVSALHVEIEEYKRGWVAFFTSVAAIVGGVVTVMGMIDKMVFSQMGSNKSDELLR